MTDVDRLDLLARIGICFKIGAEGSFGVVDQGKGCFLCSPTGFDKSLTYQMFVHAKSSSSSVQPPTALLYRLGKKGGSIRNTRLLPQAKMLLVPKNCFLCRVDYTLEEIVFTEQM